MFHYLHNVAHFWVSLWLSSLFLLALVPTWSFFSEPIEAEFILSEEEATCWSYLPGELILEEKEDLSPKKTTHRPLNQQLASTQGNLGLVKGVFALIMPAGKPKPVFLAYHHLRL